VLRCGAMAARAECMFDWDLSAEEACEVIGGFGEGYRARLARFIDAPDSSILRRRPSPEVWSALEYAAHVRDVLAFYADRIDRVLNEERPKMTAPDFSSMPERRGYLNDDPLAVLDAISDSSASVEQELRSLTPEQWTRVGIGVDGDERTTLVLARRLAHDGHHHLLDLDRLTEALLIT
jgi:DinB superfamily